MDTTPHFRAVTDITSSLFKQCLTIYHQSFPDAERQSDQVIFERINNSKCFLYAGVINEQVQCFALVWKFETTPFLFVDYLAVSAESRGTGIGRELLNYLSGTIVQPGNFLVFEVEHPGFGDNTEERIRRINFYRKAGAVLLADIRYLLPPLQQNNEPIEMQLMIAPDPAGKLQTKDFSNLVVIIYKNVYNRNDEDEILRSFL